MASASKPVRPAQGPEPVEGLAAYEKNSSSPTTAASLRTRGKERHEFAQAGEIAHRGGWQLERLHRRRGPDFRLGGPDPAQPVKFPLGNAEFVHRRSTGHQTPGLIRAGRLAPKSGMDRVV